MHYQFDLNERTASLQANPVKSIQSWKTKSHSAESAKQAIESNFEAHLKDTHSETRTAFTPTGDQAIRRDGKEPFAFHDVIDIVNPLHHLPVVGMLYRGITGDKIKPASQIIGGGLYGGPVGAVSGTVNAIAQVQTGKDVADNVLAMAGLSKSQKDPVPYKNDPESRLNAVAQNFDTSNQPPELPGTALAFVNMAEPNRGYTRVHAAEGRTAGSMIVKKQPAAYDQQTSPTQHPSIKTIDLETALPQRDAITEISLSAMPKKEIWVQ